MGLLEDAEHAERARRERNEQIRAEEDRARWEAKQPIVHPKLVELVALLKDRGVPKARWYEPKGERRDTGPRHSVQWFRRAGWGWIISGPDFGYLALDESGTPRGALQMRGSGWNSPDDHKNRGLPPWKGSWVVFGFLRLDTEQENDWAMRGATGVIGGRYRDGVILKSREQEEADERARTAGW
jgi:hypothetical protein